MRRLISTEERVRPPGVSGSERVGEGGGSRDESGMPRGETRLA